MKRKQYKEYTTYYLFTDIEATGLNYINGKYKHNDLIEISYVLLDNNLFNIDKNSFVVSSEYINFNNMNKFVEKMHSQNGLIKDTYSSCLSPKEIDSKLYHRLKELLPKNKEYRLILSGNTIQYDYEIMRRHLPLTYSLLHHRVLDISSVREAIKLFNKDFAEKVENEKIYNHRAESDIAECVKEFKKYKNLLSKKI